MNFKENKPIFVQIADIICESILSEKYLVDQRIPSVREFALQLEVNVNTVVRSFEQLQNSNIIYNKRGLGYFVSPTAKESIIAIRRKTFMDEMLPELIREMKMLGLSIDDIKDRF